MSDPGRVVYSEELTSAMNQFSQHIISSDAPALSVILQQIAHTGLTCYPWEALEKLIDIKLSERLSMFQVSSPLQDFEEVKARLHHLLEALPGPPFTLQRLCELLIAPEKWGYKTLKRYVYAVEKMLTVTSYQETLTPEQYSVALEEQYENMRNVKEKKKSGEDENGLSEGEVSKDENASVDEISHDSDLHSSSAMDVDS